MDTRREFIKKAALLAGSAGITGVLPASIQKALSIDPVKGSTYLDAEHVVFLMQENRSFDHCYGHLQGVRGFNDPRAISLPDKNKVWLQTNARGETYAPFRLDIKNTKATWMSSLPHSWTNQVDARNNGKYDKWLVVKQSGHKEYRDMPLTMGYYTREDIPFYYALADAFTVCDQNFCSSLTGTTPNRLYFWSGTIRAEQHEQSKANVWNEDADYDTMVSWKTYPERLEEHGISWKVYQNDLSVAGGFTDEEDSWMANFGDNPLEYFTQYHVKLSLRYIHYLQKQLELLPRQVEELENKMQSANSKEQDDLKAEIAKKKKTLANIKTEAAVYTREKYDRLDKHEKSLHEKAFADNKNDPAFYKLTKLLYKDGNTTHEVTIPKGDILYQFREDVNKGNLPTVSWLVAPENFSDHPSSAWYGAWYVSEVLDILTRNPEVWKKTIFVLNYDENDGYFDHVPPFVAPNPAKPETGKTSSGIDARTEFVSMDQERAKKGVAERNMRESAIGLGYRVPMVIASPWSRGGWVNSQVFDHTSALQFLEGFLEKKTGKPIRETNISSWRRAVCGDLTSVFRPYNGEKITTPASVNKNSFIEGIHLAKFKATPSAYHALTPQEIVKANNAVQSGSLLPRQETGTRPSCPLPYELYADGRCDVANKTFTITLEAGSKQFGRKSAGSPFTIYAVNDYRKEAMREWSYAVEAGKKIDDSWKVEAFEKGNYHLRVYAPNGFYREFKGDERNPAVQVTCIYQQGNVVVTLKNTDTVEKYSIEVLDHAYGSGIRTKVLNPARANETIEINTGKSFGWYDFSVKVKGNTTFEQRYAGRVETGRASQSDPAMGNLLA